MSHPALHADWDVIVIGTGMGGGTAGRALAEAGLRVLFLEQGAAGRRTERNGLSEVFVPEARLARGLWPQPLNARVDGIDSTFYAPLGAGVGGSSVFYAATLERPERHDLDDSAERPHPTGGWPVGFDGFRPWYDRAARLYRVHGTPDPLSDEPPIPLRDPPAPTATEAALTQAFRTAGLHPYHAHTAIDRTEGCLSCLGTKCPRRCKMDGRSAGVEPALATGRAALIDRAEVTRLHAGPDRIEAVEIRVAGETHRLHAPHVLLAGGALGSPRLLLASACEAWPEGLANRSGLVGRNLMFHLNEMLALWPPRGTPDSGATKALSLRDLYHREGARLGTVQAMGIRASYGEIVHYLNLMLGRSALRRLPGLRHLTRLPAALAVRLLGQAQIFVGLMEDLPYPENRVTYDPNAPERLSVDYRFHDELLQRRRIFRRAMRRAFRGQRHLFLGLGPELNFGHPSGTLRFGEDATRSVLDRDCRAHGLRNLWVADASFMPTSMAVNPSLTIAANALRVADAITKEAAA
ncbi:GMC oxidoreductase [Salipiger mucosus]|uniref:Glucose-methanol-choline (GMC) oxidoreductase:NAD binding protein site n=1 Tax=Salipiger mucosus DSM 16094 TaxID=1123237 RepID=S9QRQ2_9RHOB|nr:GMC family oxidoreductase [Salipiger mucosus]EPX82317.1 Glucose-methanol-choline (GMC) oxidoreductase:NAD binding protein site [Salipiger mucosus DSM 16094]